jgi:hypothetical protein
MVMPRATDNKQSRRPTTHQFEVDAKKAQKKEVASHLWKISN